MALYVVHLLHGHNCTGKANSFKFLCQSFRNPGRVQLTHTHNEDSGSLPCLLYSVEVDPERNHDDFICFIGESDELREEGFEEPMEWD